MIRGEVGTRAEPEGALVGAEDELKDVPKLDGASVVARPEGASVVVTLDGTNVEGASVVTNLDGASVVAPLDGACVVPRLVGEGVEQLHEQFPSAMLTMAMSNRDELN